MEQVTTLLVTPTNPDGKTDVDSLVKKDGVHEDERERTTWVEYWAPFASLIRMGEFNRIQWPKHPEDPDNTEFEHTDLPANIELRAGPEGVMVHRSAHVTLKQVPGEVQTMLGQIVAGG